MLIDADGIKRNLSSSNVFLMNEWKKIFHLQFHTLFTIIILPISFTRQAKQGFYLKII